MATDLRQPATTSAPKHEVFVDQQLDQALRRIRRLDLLAALLTVGMAALVYGLVIASLDRVFTLPLAVRGAALSAFLLGTCVYGALVAYRQLRWTVNPYYAAKRLEATVPDAKNSLINWLDLHDQPVAPALRAHLGRRAAHDLKAANLDDAISGRRLVGLAGTCGGLLVGLGMWYLLAPGQVGSLLQRAFAPFERTNIATRTEITLLSPRGGDATVPVRENVRIRVQVTGRVPAVNRPDSLRLQLRYRPEDPYIVLSLDPDADGEWSRTVVADQVLNGFWYKVTGGDAETPEHQVRVRALPQVTRFEIAYHYRPYLQRPDAAFTAGPSETRSRPEIRALRGTEVTLITRVNRPWHKGSLLLHEGGATPRELVDEAVDDDPQARRFHFVLERSGQFQVQFTSTNDEHNVDRAKHEMIAIEDRAPAAALTVPGQDVTLPANGTLALTGAASDDYGLKGLTLRLKVKDGPQQPELAPRPYQPGVPVPFADGSYPLELTFKDVIALEKLQTPKGEAGLLPAGTVLEYWLEAVDNCDYPEKDMNIGFSKKYHITMAPPDKDEKQQQQQRQQAEQDKRAHDKQQEQQLERQNQKANEEKNLTPEERAERRQKQEEEFKQNLEKVREAADKQQGKQEEPNKGTAKGEPNNPGQAKGNDQQGAGANSADAKPEPRQPGKEEAAQPKNDGQGDTKQAPGEGKDAGKPQPEQAGAQKGAGDPDATSGPQGQAKNDRGAAQENNPSSPKGSGPDPVKGKEQPPGAPKGQGAAENKETPAQAKNDSKEKAGGGQEQGTDKSNAGNDKQDAASAKGTADKEVNKTMPPTPGAARDGPKDTTQATGPEKGTGGTKEQASTTKPGGQPDSAKPEPAGQGSAKGKGEENKGTAKQDSAKGQDNPASAAAKGNDTKGQGNNPPMGKKGTPDPKTQAGAGKGGGDPKALEQESPQGGNHAQTQEALKDLLDKLESKNAQERKTAEDTLKKLAEQARDGQQQKTDPQAQKAAEEFLDKLKEGDPQSRASAEKLLQRFDELARDNMPKDQGTEQKGTDPGGILGKGSNLKDGPNGKSVGRPVGKNPAKGGNSNDGDLQADPFDPDARRRAGELQLEELKKQLTPEVLKSLKRPDGTPWTKADEQNFLDQARDYLEWLRREDLRGGAPRPGQSGTPVPQLPSQGPRAVNANPTATLDPLAVGGAQPPPEYSDAQRRFSSRGKD